MERGAEGHFTNKQMVYKRRRRGRSSRRKRRKKSYNSRIARVAIRAVNKAQQSKRQYINESRKHSISVDAGNYKYQCLCSLGNADTTLDGGNSFTQVIESALGQDGVALGGDSADQFATYCIENFTVMNHLRNLSPHPVFVTVYEIVARKHTEIPVGGAAGVTTYMLQNIYDGWRELMGTGAGVAPVFEGDQVTSVPTAGGMNTESNALSITHSRDFSKRWKIMSKKKYKLNAGDDVYWRLSIPYFKFHPNFYLPANETGTEQNIEIIKNVTRVLMIKLEGALGHGTGVNQDKIGPMSSDLAYECMTKARVYKMNSTSEPTISLKVEEDDLTGVNLEGPTEHTVIEDE